MREYLIEVPHSPNECSVVPAVPLRARRLRGYRGCEGGTHTTWIIGELEAEEDAWRLVPPLLVDTARVVPVERTASKEGT